MNHYLRKADDERIREELMKNLSECRIDSDIPLKKLNKIVSDHFKNDEYTRFSKKYFGREDSIVCVYTSKDGTFADEYSDVRIPIVVPFVVIGDSNVNKYKREITNVLNEYLRKNPDRSIEEYILKLHEMRENHLLKHKGRFRFINEFPEEFRGNIDLKPLIERDNKFLKELIGYIPNRENIIRIEIPKNKKLYSVDRDEIKWLLNKFIHNLIEKNAIDTTNNVDDWFKRKVSNCFSDEEKKVLGPSEMNYGQNYLLAFCYHDGILCTSESDSDVIFCERGFDLMVGGTNRGLKNPSPYMIKYMNGELNKDGDVVHEYVRRYLEWKSRKEYFEEMINIALSLETTDDINDDLNLILSYLHSLDKYMFGFLI